MAWPAARLPNASHLPVHDDTRRHARPEPLQVPQPRIFLYLLGYRWLSLIPALVTLFPGVPLSPTPRVVLALAALENAGITLLHPHLTRQIQTRPWLLAIDLILCAAFIASSGGVHSPYYLYALGPLLGAAFFFHIRGGLLAAAALSLLYALAVAADIGYLGGTLDLLLALTQMAGFFLIAGIFGYPAILLDRLRGSAALQQQMHEELARNNVALERANRELRSVHNLAVTLQSAAIDIREVQQLILSGVVHELGFDSAAMALVDFEQAALTDWLILRRDGGWDDSLYDAMVPTDGHPAIISEVLRQGEPRLTSGDEPLAGHADLDRKLRWSTCAVLPMIVRAMPMGVLVAGAGHDTLDADALASARSVVEHGSAVLWTTRMCMERAHRLAIEEERARIAQDIHDAVSQSLFGIAYTLDGCTRLLPQQPEVVGEKLTELHALALRTMADMRRFIFDMGLGTLTTSQFIDELRSSLHDMGAPETLRADISVEGDITELTPYTRKHLFRIAQEALGNVVKHSGAARATVRMEAAGDQVRLTVSDDGRGFDPERSAGRGLGLAGMRERVRSIGGTVRITSAPGRGTTIEAFVPRL